MLPAVLTGFLSALSLIVAIGAQNAFVLRQGLRREHVLPVVLVCAGADALLIAAGIAGLGALVDDQPVVLRVVRYAGAAFLLVLAVPVYASQAPQRQSDADVKALIEDVNQARDRFEDALDGKIKNGIVRGPSGETKVEAFLQDLQDNVNKLKERFTDRYAASAEALNKVQSEVYRVGAEIARVEQQIQHHKEMTEQLTRAREETERAHAELAAHIADDSKRRDEVSRHLADAEN